MVTDGRTLAGMARQGFIKWSPGTDRHWTGQRVKHVCVDEGPNLPEPWNAPWTYRGKQYQLRYVNGCIFPFVFEVGSKVPSFV